MQKGRPKNELHVGGLAATAEHVNKQPDLPADAAVRGVVKFLKKTALAFENWARSAATTSINNYYRIILIQQHILINSK